MLVKEEIIKKLEENRERIKKYGVRRIGLFGSYARGEERQKGDIDILVEFEKGKKTFDNYMGLVLFLEDLLGLKVDLVIRENIKTLLKLHILKGVEYAKGL